MKKGPPKEEKGEQAPLWIISFADMISLLMAFFVMLLAMASSKSDKVCGNGESVFERSIGSFNDSVRGFGLPGLFGQKLDLKYEKKMVYYPIKSIENGLTNQRIIDAAGEQTKKLFNQLNAEAATSSSTIKGTQTIFTPTPILFGQSVYELKKEDKIYLDQFCLDVKNSSRSDNVTVIVIGTAEEKLSFRDKWLVSVQRAGAVAEYIKQYFSDSSVNVVAWGTNNPLSWGKCSLPTGEVHILLSVLNSN